MEDIILFDRNYGVGAYGMELVHNRLMGNPSEAGKPASATYSTVVVVKCILVTS